ncbi:hypothetical protein C9426_35105 [Serratia sp. S1B]|nr:hypothetical protein C9426_35105 [Serratia sp. S1B]
MVFIVNSKAKNITCSVEISSDNYYFKYGLYKMISQLNYSDITLNTKGNAILNANIIFNETTASINCVISEESRDGSLSVKNVTIYIPFFCTSLSQAEVMAKLEKIMSLSELTRLSVNEQDIYQKIKVRPQLQLSNTENKVLGYFGEGYRTKDIANKLCCSDKTINTHRRNAMRKLGISKKSELYNFGASVIQNTNSEKVTLCL